MVYREVAELGWSTTSLFPLSYRGAIQLTVITNEISNALQQQTMTMYFRNALNIIIPWIWDVVKVVKERVCVPLHHLTGLGHEVIINHTHSALRISGNLHLNAKACGIMLNAYPHLSRYIKCVLLRLWKYRWVHNCEVYRPEARYVHYEMMSSCGSCEQCYYKLPK